MTRKTGKLVFATNNSHKLHELRSILPAHIQLLSLADIDCHTDIPETGETLEENSLQKARFIHDLCGMDCIADDTGLEVNALDGAPGVYSARYAGDGHDSKANMELLLRNMATHTDRSARFRTVITLVTDDEVHAFEGIVTGKIATEPAGDSGFGYDPVFIPTGWDMTFAQAPESRKNAISHRAVASHRLVEFLNSAHDRH
ncbi:MAG: non-canonical purine NTP diphosphatase [Muribaculaceae bacterium]|nr:non-canonical purine NTP diphosphatase [Muribaculaceae bacterium]